MTVTVRVGDASDAEALAGLRWRRVVQERGGDGGDREEFVAAQRRWMTAHASTHIPFLAEKDGEIVGMAWLMIAERVPTPNDFHRRFGDVQSVFVVPELRNEGVGTLLMRKLLTTADDEALEHVTVHSSTKAVTFYRRHGFTNQDTALIRP